jgi:type I restriction enzyme M protein
VVALRVQPKDDQFLESEASRVLVSPPGKQCSISAADALRNNMDAAEYKHVVLGLIFLKYISDAFEAKHAELAAQKAQGSDPEDPDEYRATLLHSPAHACHSESRSDRDEESRPEPAFPSVIPSARPGLDTQQSGQVINFVSDIALGSSADRAKDILEACTNISSPSSPAPRTILKS